tara:strand:+ start:1743 stop:1940 length:198 start_codon:yes stop_codon:yes gene_type:complete
MAATKNKQEQIANKIANLENRISDLKDQNMALKSEVNQMSKKFSNDVKNLYDAFKALGTRIDQKL